MTANNALQLVQLGQLVDNVAESAHKGLQSLGQTLPALPDEERCHLTLIRYCSSRKQRCTRQITLILLLTPCSAVQEASSVAPPARHTAETAASACAN